MIATVFQNKNLTENLKKIPLIFIAKLGSKFDYFYLREKFNEQIPDEHFKLFSEGMRYFAIKKRFIGRGVTEVLEKKYQVVDELYDDLDKKYENNVDSILIKLFIFWLVVAVLLLLLQDMFDLIFPKVLWPEQPRPQNPSLGRHGQPPGLLDLQLPQTASPETDQTLPRAPHPKLIIDYS